MLALALVSLLAAAGGGDGPLAIEGVSVIPMDGERVLAGQTVLVRDGRIEALGPANTVAIPDDARRIDGTGRYLMPGLADMDAQVWDANELFLFVANGVTAVRNTYGDPLHLAWRARIRRGELLGPRLYTAGPIVDGSPPAFPRAAELAEPEDAARIVAEQKAAGYDFVECHTNLSAACHAALAEAARAQGMPLMGRVPAAVELRDALDAGQATIEHLDGWALATRRTGAAEPEPGLHGEELAWQETDAKRFADLARRLRKAGTWSCPALVAKHKWVTGAAAEELLARPEVRYVSPTMRALWRRGSPANFLARLPEATLDVARASLPVRERAVAALADAEAGILLGTGHGAPLVVAGFSVHEELALLVAAGLSPYEALRAATADPARALGAADDWGTIAVGRRADLLLLDANPLADVGNAARRAGVVVAGRFLSEEELRAELERRAAEFAQR